MGHQPKPFNYKSQSINFGIEFTIFLGSAKCCFLIENVQLKITVFIMYADASMLLSLTDRDPLRLSYDNAINILTHKPSGACALIQREFGHLFLSWSRKLNHFLPNQSSAICTAVLVMQWQRNYETFSLVLNPKMLLRVLSIPFKKL